LPDPLALVRATLYKAERARILRETGAEPVFYVTEIASGGRGGGSSAEAGRELHREAWGLDPFDVVNVDRWAGPLPLAWCFRFGWVYGVCDLAVFDLGRLKRVVEVKSYGRVRERERAQAALYGLLAALNFLSKPEVVVWSPSGEVAVVDWEALALNSLTRWRSRELARELLSAH
jgi:hypothetical protein